LLWISVLTSSSLGKDFRKLVRRIPEGNRTAFRRLGRITFRCNEVNGVAQLRRWIDHIELL